MAETDTGGSGVDSWEDLRKALLTQAKEGTGGEALWDIEEIHAALEEANAKGLNPKLVLSCWEACRSQEEFTKELDRMIAGRKTRIFSVDDEASFGELLKLNLEKTERYEVAVESDPRKALERAKAFHPDLIILDVIMPEISGPELVRQLRADKETRGVPIMMLTSLLEGSEVGAVTREGILYLSKPIRTVKLIHCIEEHLKSVYGGGTSRSGAFSDPF